MMIAFFRDLIRMEMMKELLELEYAPARRALRSAGLSERALRRMMPDQRVAALEHARLNPYDYIYLSC